jgi:hypothetical protein
MMIPLMVLLAVQPVSAQSAPPCGELVPTLPAVRDYETHLRQARHFERKGWLSDAAHEASMARSSRDGHTDPAAWALSARLARMQGDIVGARCLAAATLDLKRSGAATEEARALLRELDRAFGYLTVFTEGDAATTTLRIAPPRLFASAELKEFAEAQVAKYRERFPLPVRLALPAGAYVINGQSITIVPGESQEMVLSANRTRPAWASPVARATVGASLRGGEVGSPPPVAALVRTDLTLPIVRKPAWSLRGGLVGGVELPAVREDGSSVPAGGEVGGLVSGVWSTGLGLELRADLSMARGSTSGLAVSCPLDGSACLPDNGSEPVVPADLVMVRAASWRSTALLGIEQRRFGQLQLLGIGAVGGITRSMGELSADIPSQLSGSPPLSETAFVVDGITCGVTVSLHR